MINNEEFAVGSKMAKVYISINGAANRDELSSGLEDAVKLGINGIHCDLFCNQTGSQQTNAHIFTPTYLAQIRDYFCKNGATDFDMDVHMFAEEVWKYFQGYLEEGISRLTFPYSAFNKDPDIAVKTLTSLRMQLIPDLKEQKPKRAQKVRIGLSFLPDEFKSGFDVNKFNVADHIIILGAAPGYDRFSAFPSVEEFLREAHEQIVRVKQGLKWFDIEVGVEGGVNLNNIGTMISAGADRVIIGGSYFRSDHGSRKMLLDLAKFG